MIYLETLVNELIKYFLEEKEHPIIDMPSSYVNKRELLRGLINVRPAEPLDEEIIKMTNKENPNFLFIGLASSYSDSYYDTIKKIYKEKNMI